MTRTTTRSLALAALTAGIATLATACADDEVLPGTGAAGTTSAGGTSGGKSGTGGSSGTGTGGVSGQGGTAGKGGAGTGGTGGAGAGGAGKGGASGAGAGGAGAGGSGGSTLCGDATGDGKTAKVTKVSGGATDYVSPFDATPSPDGCTIYFTAIDPKTLAGAVFSVSSTGTGLKRLDTGNTLVAPVGVAVSTDGKTLYVADAAFGTGATDNGALLSLSSGGGAVTTVIAGKSPTGVSVSKQGAADQIFFTGSNATGAAAVFSAAAGAGTATEVVAPGGALGGVAVASATKFFVVSSTGNALLQVDAGAASSFAGGLRVGLSAGVALAGDGTAALVASSSATGGSGIVRIVLGDKTTTFTAVGTGLVEPSGIHRAHNAEVYAFTDSLDTTGLGSVWVAQK